MQKRLYRFEIARGLAHAIYLATDMATQSLVLLYEWTPPAPELASCLSTLDVLVKANGCEAFSAGASLYLVAASEEDADKVLPTLRDRGLFTGTWTGAPAPTLGPPPLPPPPLEEQPRRGPLVLFLLTVIAVLIASLVWSLASGGR